MGYTPFGISHQLLENQCFLHLQNLHSSGCDRFRCSQYVKVLHDFFRVHLFDFHALEPISDLQTQIIILVRIQVFLDNSSKSKTD